MLFFIGFDNRTVTSTLHQKIKVPYKGRLVIIKGENDKRMAALIMEGLLLSFAGFQIDGTYED